jgi:cell volume regulation protein A
MGDARHFALIVLLCAAAALAAIVSNRLTERIKVPAALLMLVAAAIAVKISPALAAPPGRAVERILTVALVCILFDGGMHIGLARFRPAAGPILIVGVVGTFATTAAAALLMHAVIGLAWFPALLVATAISPTDPAMVFSVLGQREIAGRSSTILEGESGANDPVGIALLLSLLAAGGVSGHAFAHVGVEFVLEMGVGTAIGVAGGIGLRWFVQRVALPAEGLYPLRTLASALALYGLATVAHGSGFLAVFVAGIVVGDARVPFRREVARFHGALANLAEIVAFLVLGLTVDLSVLARADVWAPGLALGVVVAFVIRPLAVGLCLIPARLRRSETMFVLFAGLKGAVPLLLGVLIIEAHVAHAARLYGIVVVAVVFSVLVQGSCVPLVARWLGLTTDGQPMTNG